MRARWQALAARFARLKRREQILVSLACAALAYFLIDALLISPALVQQKRLAQGLDQVRGDTAKLSAQVAVLKAQRAVDPDAQSRNRLADTQQRLADVQANIQEQSGQIVPPEKMSAVLERMLARHPSLELVELRTLAQSPIPAASADPKPAGKPVAEQGGAAAEPQIYKHGVRISLRGGYLELLEYLRSLEALPGRLYWEQLDFAVEEYPAATLRITLYTISFDSAWMKV